MKAAKEAFSRDFEVEKIIKHRKKGGQFEFLVKWADYNKKHNLPPQNLAGLEVFEEYLVENRIKL